MYPIVRGMKTNNYNFISFSGLPTKDLRNFLSTYGYQYAFTDAIMVEARSKAKLAIFGSASDNVKYAMGVEQELKKMGHFVELIYCSRSKILSKLGHVVLAEEGYRRKNDEEPPLTPQERKPFLDNWKQQHAVELGNQIGLKDGPQFNFLSGILFATSTSKENVPLLQKVSPFTSVFCRCNDHFLTDRP